MRKVTKQVAKAFANRESFTDKNTRTDGHTIYLHGTPIVWRARTPLGGHEAICYTQAGWPTNTTHERLNGVADYLGHNIRFYTEGGIAKAHVPYSHFLRTEDMIFVFGPSKALIDYVFRKSVQADTWRQWSVKAERADA
jgi:hypothetical protein